MIETKTHLPYGYIVRGNQNINQKTKNQKRIFQNLLNASKKKKQIKFLLRTKTANRDLKKIQVHVHIYIYEKRRRKRKKKTKNRKKFLLIEF